MPHVAQPVLFISPDHGNEPLCALVAAVLDENKVNVTVFAKDGSYAGGHGSIPFLPDHPDKPKGPYCIAVETGSMTPEPPKSKKK